jgi:hypothetical protein
MIQGKPFSVSLVLFGGFAVVSALRNCLTGRAGRWGLPVGLVESDCHTENPPPDESKKAA